jgi:hypothetical protein
MKNILSYQTFSNLSECSISFDWSELELSKELSEKLYFIHTDHAYKYRYGKNDIEAQELIEEFIMEAFPIILRFFNTNERREKDSFTISSKNFPYVVGLEMSSNKKYNNLSVVGNLYDYDRVYNTPRDEHFKKLKQVRYGLPIEIKDFMGRVLEISFDDYIFKIITISRREDFIAYAGDIHINLDEYIQYMNA